MLTNVIKSALLKIGLCRSAMMDMGLESPFSGAALGLSMMHVLFIHCTQSMEPLEAFCP